MQRRKKPQQQVRERRDYGTEEQRVEVPIKLARAGRFISPKALKIYLVILSYNPSFPSIRRLRIEAGYAFEAVINGLEELEVKKLIRRNSGQQERDNNHYETRPYKDWELSNPVKRPKDKIAERKRLKGISDKKKGRFEIRNTDASKFETSADSNFEKELDQFNQDQSIISDASRHRCPADILYGSEKGVALSDDITSEARELPLHIKREIAELNTKIDGLNGRVMPGIAFKG